MKSAEITKISAAFHPPMFASFERQLKQTFTLRDAFLDHVIANEIPHIRKDLKGKRNSAKARSFIAAELRKIENGEIKRTPVSIKVRHSTAQALRDVEEAHNLVRDALLNRVVMMLRSTKAMLKALDLPYEVSSSRFQGDLDVPTSPLVSISQTTADPFYPMRIACRAAHDCGIYELELPAPLRAFSCYLPDEEIAGTAAKRRSLRAEKKMAEMWDDLVSSSPLSPKKKNGGSHG